MWSLGRKWLTAFEAFEISRKILQWLTGMLIMRRHFFWEDDPGYEIQEAEH